MTGILKNKKVRAIYTAKIANEVYLTGECIYEKKCHHLKPFGIAYFTESAVLQGTSGSRLQRRALRLAVPANSTIAKFR